MMKKLFKNKSRLLITMLFAFLVISCAFSVSVTLSVFAETYVFNKDNSFIDDNGKDLICYPITDTEQSRTAAVAWGKTPAEGTGALVIPATVRKKTGDGANDYIDYTVKAVAQSGFRYCDFTSVSFAQNNEVDEIQSEAFYSCQNMTTFTFPQKCVKGIAPSTFMDCRNLETIDMSATNSYIDAQLAAEGGDDFAAANHFDIGDHAFTCCMKLADFEFPATLSDIGEGAFQRCAELYALFFPSDNEINGITIGKYAFADCGKLAICHFALNLDDVDEYAFAMCDQLFIYYAGTEADADNTFGKVFRKRHVATNMTDTKDYVPIVENVGDLEVDREHYPGLTYFKSTNIIYYEGSNDSGNTKKPVLDNSKIEYVTLFRFQTPEEDVPGYYENHSLTIPNQIDGAPVKVISKEFYEKNNDFDLQKVYFNTDLVQIGRQAFYGCNELDTIDFSASQKLQEISHDAFNNPNSGSNSHVTSLSIPASVKYIGNNAFCRFTAVNSLTIPSTSKLEIIGNSAFYNLGSGVNPSNYSINLTLPNTMKDSTLTNTAPPSNPSACIGHNAFHNCPLLKTVKYAATENRNSIGKQAFSDCVNLLRFESNKGLDKIDTAAFENCTKLKELFISDYVHRNLKGKDSNNFIWGNGEGNSIFFSGDDSESKSKEFRDLVVYVDQATAPGRRPRQAKYYIWNSDPRTYKNEYATSAYTDIRGPSLNRTTANSDFRTDNVIGRSIVPTYYGVEFYNQGEVNYISASTGDPISAPQTEEQYADAVAYVTKEKTYDANGLVTENKNIITRCWASNLSEIDMTNWNIDVIGSCAFATLSNGLIPSEKIFLPSGLNEIRDRAFYSVAADGVNVVTYKNGSGKPMPVTSEDPKPKYCFLPSAVERVDRYAFYNNDFDKVVLPSSLDFLGNTVFTGSPGKGASIRHIELGTSLTFGLVSVGDTYGVYDKETGTLLFYTPKGSGNSPSLDLSGKTELSVLGPRCFAGANYTSVTLPTSIQTIYGGAFGSNSALTSVSGLTGLKYISSATSNVAYNGTNHFDLFDYDYNVYDPFDYLGDGNTYRHNRPNYFQWIGNFGAFANCTNLTTFNFRSASQLEKIGYGAFEGCKNLYDMTGHSDNYAYYRYKSGVTEANVFASYDQQSVDTFDYGIQSREDDKYYGVLDLSQNTNMTTIGRGAFKGCESIRYIHLPILQEQNTGKTVDTQAKFYLGIDRNEYATWYSVAEPVKNASNQKSVFEGTSAETTGGAVLFGESAKYARKGISGGSYLETIDQGKNGDKNPTTNSVSGNVDVWDNTKYYIDRYPVTAYKNNNAYFYVRGDHYTEDIYNNVGSDVVKYWTFIGDPEDHNYMLFENKDQVISYFGSYQVKVNGNRVANAARPTDNNSDKAKFAVNLEVNQNLTVFNGNTQLTQLDGSTQIFTATVAGEYIVVVDSNNKWSIDVAVYPATNVSINEGDSKTLYLGVDDSYQLSASVSPRNSTDAVTWSSDDGTVATVSSSGLVTPAGTGTTTIRATAGSYSDTFEVTVEHAYSVVISDGNPILLNLDDENKPEGVVHQYSAQISPEKGDTIVFKYDGTDLTIANLDGNLEFDNDDIKVSWGSDGYIYLKDKGSDVYETYYGFPTYNLYVNNIGVSAFRANDPGSGNKARYSLEMDNGDTLIVKYGKDELNISGDSVSEYTASYGGMFTIFVTNSDELVIEGLSYGAFRIVGSMNEWSWADGITGTGDPDYEINGRGQIKFNQFTVDTNVEFKINVNNGSDWYGTNELNIIGPHSGSGNIALDAGTYQTYLRFNDDGSKTLLIYRVNVYRVVGVIEGENLWPGNGESTYYLAGNSNANLEEYKLTMTFADNDEVKVFNGTYYWPDGNNYGIADHGGTKVVYFRPNGDGGEGWHYHVIYMVDVE